MRGIYSIFFLEGNYIWLCNYLVIFCFRIIKYNLRGKNGLWFVFLFLVS